MLVGLVTCDMTEEIFIMTWGRIRSGRLASTVTEKCGIAYPTHSKPNSGPFWVGDD